jgi:rhamnulokinase
VSRYLAVDLGAESGRVIAGVFGGERIELEEIHRFPNVPVRTPDGLHWDTLGIYREILAGLRRAGDLHAGDVDGIGVDSWGVDYGLIDSAGRLLGNPYHYRDARTDGMPAESAKIVPASEQFERTGIAQLQFNTVYQLMAAVRAHDHTIDLAQHLLMMPDLMHYWLCGEQACEETNGSTSGALGIDGAWARDMLARLSVPDHMLTGPVAAGAVLGRLRPGTQQECSLGPVPVILPPTHDTACAVVAVPAEPKRDGRGHIYLSSGTWSLMGMELKSPNTSEAARLAGFTNERGAGGTFRFHTNIMGLWLLQESRRAWARDGIHTDWSYQDLMERAAAVESPRVVINVDDPAFLHPDDMPAAILAQLDASERGRLRTPEVLARAILESLAIAYRVTVERVEQLTREPVGTVHIVGGGSRNSLLCQLAADATGRQVVAGPTEATALGNVIVQAVGAGEIRGMDQVRDVARASAQVTRYEPRSSDLWEDLHGRLIAMREKAQTASLAGG